LVIDRLEQAWRVNQSSDMFCLPLLDLTPSSKWCWKCEQRLKGNEHPRDGLLLKQVITATHDLRTANQPF